MDLPDDDHLTRSVTELGEPDALFRISNGRFLAKLGLGVGLVVLGAAGNYYWWVHGPANFDAIVAHFLILVPFFGVALLWHMYRQRGLYVLVYPTGLLRLRRGEVDSFPWREVEHVRLKVQRASGAELTRGPDGAPVACWLPAEVPTFRLWDAGLSVARDDGVVAHLGPALTDYDRLAEEVQKRTFAVAWPRVWADFLDGRAVAFGDIEASRAGMRHGGKFIPWADVKELSVAQGRLSVKRGGKWLPWILLDIHTIPNPHVLFALAVEAGRHWAAAPPPVGEPKHGAAG